MLEHGAGIESGQRFAGETGGGVPGWDNGQDFAVHTRSYHDGLVLDSRQKGKHRDAIPPCLYFCLRSPPRACFAGEPLDAKTAADISSRAPKPGEQPAAPLPKANIRVDTNVVLIPVTVTDPLNRFVTGLDQDVFKVFEDKVEQKIVSFGSEDAPLSIGIVFDTSGSMGPKLEKSRQAVAEFFKTANPEDEAFLVEFNDRPELVTPFTHNLEEIQNRLTFTQSKGRTALLDGVCWRCTP